jgi:penicillin G amidase
LAPLGARGRYDLKDPGKSRFTIATVESRHILSSHYGDLVPAWNNVGSITLAATEDELKQATARS